MLSNRLGDRRKKSSKRKRLSVAPGKRSVLKENDQNGSASAGLSVRDGCKSPAKQARVKEGAGVSGSSGTALTAVRAPSEVPQPTAFVVQTSPSRVSSAAATNVHNRASNQTPQTCSQVVPSRVFNKPRCTMTQSDQHVPKRVAQACLPDTGSDPQDSIQTLHTRGASTQRLSATRRPAPGSTAAESTWSRTAAMERQEMSNSFTCRPQRDGQQANPGSPVQSPDELRAREYQHRSSSRSPQRLGCRPVRLQETSAAHAAIPETPRQQYGRFLAPSTRPSPTEGQGSDAAAISLLESTVSRSCKTVQCSPCRITPSTTVATPVHLQGAAPAPPRELRAAAKPLLTTQALHHVVSHVASTAQQGAATKVQSLLHPSRWTKSASTACGFNRSATAVSQHKPGPCVRNVGILAPWTSLEQKADDLDRFPRKYRGILPAKEASAKAFKRASPGDRQAHQPRTSSVPTAGAAKNESDEDDDFVTGSLYCPKPKAEDCSSQALLGISKGEVQQQDSDDKGVCSMRVIKLGPAPSGTWTRVIQPYTAREPAEDGGPVIAVPDLLEYDYETLGGGFLGVLLSPPLVDTLPTSAADAGGTPMLTSTQLAQLPFGGAVVIPCGLVFVEVLQKEHIPEMVRCMDSWGFRYVESCTRVWLGTDNKFLEQEAPYFRRSHSTVLIGRKGDTLELRHQRSPDVLVEPRQGEDTGMAHSIKEMIETLLPEANPNRTSTPRLLELCWTKLRKQNMIATGKYGWITMMQSPS